ncbi:MAG TPA: adenosine deaminase [Gemmatimonadaceae bacterium]|nr:adenosine deaminase [Gemmatimonadaceae bacterium]
MTTVITRELVRTLPKAELHCHLDGSVRPETLLELGREYGEPMPADDPEALAEYMIVRDARHLEDYLARFSVTLSVMQRREALERVAYELMEDAVRDGVRYLEMRYSPVLNLREGLSLGDAVEAPLAAIDRARRDFGIRGGVILCTLRDLPAERSLELARLAVAYRHRGVVGFDLAGGEKGNPAAPHAAAFAYAREHDMAVTVHAGEGDGPESVREAVHACRADRLGHATRLIEDESLAQYVNDRRIALEICLTSNVQTRVTSSYEAHPLRAYYDRGMNVVLNTDNRLMSGTTLSDEYLHAANHLDFTFDELCDIALNGFAAAFLPWEERMALIDEALADIQSVATPG